MKPLSETERVALIRHTAKQIAENFHGASGAINWGSLTEKDVCAMADRIKELAQPPIYFGKGIGGADKVSRGPAE